MKIAPGFVTPHPSKSGAQKATGKSLPMRDPIVGKVLEKRKKRKKR